MKISRTLLWVGILLMVAAGCSDSVPGSGEGGKGKSSARDTDNDGIPDSEDPDIDGDDIPNGQDPDVDGDGILNAVDEDFDAGTGWTGSQPDATTGIAPDFDAGPAVDGGKQPDDPNCGSSSIDTTVEKVEVPGNVIVIYDKSGSMNDPWNLPDGTPSTRLLASAKAFLDALGPIATKVNVGSIFFPSSGDCNVAALNSGTQIDMMAGPDYLAAWNTYWMSNTAQGRTPLLEALMSADATLSTATFEGTTVVVVITDGDPNCSWDDDTSPGVANGLAASWLANGIKTYVIGLPGTSGTGDTILTDLAAAGGTTTFIKTTDSMVLQTEIAKIATDTVTTQLDSCVIKLDPPPPATDKVQMVATENGKELSVPRVINDDAGWSIVDDGKTVTVTLEGLLCRDAKEGRFSKITFAYGCVDLPPIPPPKPE